MSDQVDIVHAGSGGEATVGEREYRAVWHGHGWRLADGSDADPEPEPTDDEAPAEADHQGDEPTSQPDTGRAKPRSKPRSA